MISPILLITFNRLEYTKKTFEPIRRAKPPRLYLASDGPREHVQGEDKTVQEIRDWLLNNVDWECEVYTRFLDKNSGGCEQGVTGAVTWFFSREKEGIVLEDDCVASSSFFVFCDELLERYREDKRIWHITGSSGNFIRYTNESYYFSKIMCCWGWASWADRWQYFKLDISDYDEKYILNLSDNMAVRNVWSDMLAYQKRKSPTWDYAWAFLIIQHNGLCAVPYKNLVSNIGEIGVHYKSSSEELNRKVFELAEIIHPNQIEVLPEYEGYLIELCEKEQKKLQKRYYKHWYERIFSVKNFGRHKIITVVGIKIKKRI